MNVKAWIGGLGIATSVSFVLGWVLLLTPAVQIRGDLILIEYPNPRGLALIALATVLWSATCLLSLRRVHVAHDKGGP